MAKTLTKETITAWRDFSQTPEFENGLQYILSERCPRPQRNDKLETQMNDTLRGAGYRDCAEDIRDLLTQYPIDESQELGLPPLQR